MSICWPRKLKIHDVQRKLVVGNNHTNNWVETLFQHGMLTYLHADRYLRTSNQQKCILLPPETVFALPAHQ